MNIKRNKPNKFIKFTDRTEVQSENIDDTLYTDQTFKCSRMDLMKNVELGFPEPGQKFLNGRCIKTTTLMENIEEAIIATDDIVDTDVITYIQNAKNAVIKPRYIEDIAKDEEGEAGRSASQETK